MKAVVFDVKGKIAHFRRPDTTATHLTYPFITPTAVKGLVGAILGREDFVTKDKVGIQLLNPVQTVAQQMSMLGKDSSSSTFNRPTTIELLINPGYRIYYAGNENVDLLYEFLSKQYSVYPTYLGCAYALTKPVLRSAKQNLSAFNTSDQEVEIKTVVPTSAINKLVFKENRYYSRGGGYLYIYKGNRSFEKSIDFIYEREGRSVIFIPKKELPKDIRLGVIGEETVCLV